MQQYIIQGWDGTDEKALERRMNARPAHLEGARKLKTTGHYVLGGAILNEEGKMIGSTMVLQFESKEQLQQWIDSEPYIIEKVWEKIDIRSFKVADV